MDYVLRITMMKNNYCSVCNAEMPEERVEMGFSTCVAHSNARAPIGFMVFSHKTAPEIAIVSTSNSESVRQAKRAFNRER
jgi:hypothetical protein